jgi:protein-tyrosine phosphatase
MTNELASDHDGGHARILVVCTGNVCRSPLAEALLRQRLLERGVSSDQVRVESAGVRALVGDPMTEPAEGELRSLGGDAAGFASRQLTPEMIDAADLVVTAERSHRAAVVQMLPRALRYTFTVRELHRLMADADLSQLPGAPAERVRRLPLLASQRKGMSAVSAPEDDDVEDPYRRSAEQYARTTSQLAPPVEALADVIGGR